MAISRQWSFLRSATRKIWNRQVNDWFKDIPADALPDNSGGRASARAACLLGGQDSQQTILIKQNNFNFLKEAITLLPKVTGEVYADIDETFEHRPCITLHFLQDLDAVPDGLRAVPARISFKLVNETSDTITEFKLQEIAREIKTQFALGNGHIWRKGSEKVTYLDKKNGLDLRILCLNETEGRELVQKVCAVIDKPFDDQLFQHINPSKNSITNPIGTDLILGKRVKKRRWRPVVNVRFLYATAKISGLENAVPLVDRSKQYFQAYEFL